MTSPVESTLDATFPSQIKEIEELAIAISAKNLNPTMLSEEFLKFSGIVPNDWELAKPSVLNPNFAQVTFQNGVSVIAQPRTISFLEPIATADSSELKSPNVARQYVEKLPHAEYQGLSVSPKSLIPFPGRQDAARLYITTTLLAPGEWQEFGKAPVQAGLNLLYQLEHCQFTLSINEARLQISEQAGIPALLFAGSFNYPILSESQSERLEQLDQDLARWHSDLEAFREVVHQKFLGQPQSVFPTSFR
jgi:hypothetical protein